MLIISILSAIIYSIMRSAKNRSFEAVDIAQMKQLFVGVTLYEEQNDGVSPIWITQVEPIVKSRDIFRSPVDPVIKAGPRGYPIVPFLSEDETVPYRVSYIYLRSIPPYNYDELRWSNLRSQSQIGMLASPWHGKHLDWYSPTFGPAADGPILRICMDGSLYRLNKRLYPTAGGAVTDLFFVRN
jgi:hypothetical protein